MRLLEHIFLYFAKYPATTAVSKFFTKGSGDTAYNTLKTAATAAAAGKYPAITDYIFGVNEESVTRRISQVKGIYLFIDYGNITSSTDRVGTKSDTFSVAVTVAKPISAGALDLAQEVLLSEDLLQIISAIRKDLREDESNSLMEYILFPNDITPFYARELSNSYGWTLMFQVRGVDMI